MFISKKAFRTKPRNHNLEINIYNGIFYAVAINLVNPYFAKFAERLGASDYELAFLNSWPAFVSIFALIPGALLIEGFGNKKKSTTFIMFAHKLFYLALATVPFINQISKPWLFVFLVGLMNFPGSVYLMGYQTCIGDLFSPRERSHAMGLRNRYSDLFRLAITLIAGQLLTRIPQNNQEVIFLYQIFFLIAFVFGILEVITFNRFKLHIDRNQKILSTRASLKEAFAFVFHDREFKIFLMCSLTFYFGWQMGWPLFNIYLIKTLGANEAWLSAVSIASGLSSILTSTLWAKFADKYGNTLTIAIATFGMSITPILYAMSSSLWMLVVFNVIIGISIAGTILVLFNMLLEVTPDQNRTTIISIYNTFIAISATIAPIIGVAIKDMTHIKTALIIVGCLRLLGSFTFYLRKRFA
ncbi:MFS transporter [Fusibacter sp. 3D3]|uniref:MFS transporter n=1 Tax=Fusibacter sp. 3D3 TaxID=1048380 RepID=UPI000853B1C2|nr:MFS transporter [Fusibacter sp. 3D3]GAU79412.1 permeases of the major facilitator superfamily [Fusibacter sp. 3D3]